MRDHTDTDTDDSPTIPAHLNASDFTLYNASPEYIAQLQLALDNTQYSGDRAGTAILQAMWLDGGRIVFNGFAHPSDAALSKLAPEMREYLTDHPGIDGWDPATHAMYWNPNAALEVRDSEGNVLGVQSPGGALAHEGAHGLDPQLIVHLDDIIPQWHNTAEFLATAYDNMSAAARGEVQRDHYGSPTGTVVEVANSTVHTGVDALGNPVWLQKNAFGGTEIGPAYDFQHIAPVWHDQSVPPDPGRGPEFGSTIPSGYYHDGDDSGYFNDGSYHVTTPAGGDTTPPPPPEPGSVPPGTQPWVDLDAPLDDTGDTMWILHWGNNTYDLPLPEQVPWLAPGQGDGAQTVGVSHFDAGVLA